MFPNTPVCLLTAAHALKTSSFTCRSYMQIYSRSSRCCCRFDCPGTFFLGLALLLTLSLLSLFGLWRDAYLSCCECGKQLERVWYHGLDNIWGLWEQQQQQHVATQTRKTRLKKSHSICLTHNSSFTNSSLTEGPCNWSIGLFGATTTKKKKKKNLSTFPCPAISWVSVFCRYKLAVATVYS